MKRRAEVVTVAMRLWAPDGPLPEVALPNEEWLTVGQIQFLFTHINRAMQNLGHGNPQRLVVFVDQRVSTLNAGALIWPIVAEDDFPAIWSPSIALSGMATEPWHEPINPYAWAARSGVLARMAPVWDHHLQFGHETLMAEACTAAGIEMCCRPNAVAVIDGDGKANGVTGDLYYRQLEDAAAVARVMGREGPSA